MFEEIEKNQRERLGSMPCESVEMEFLLSKTDRSEHQRAVSRKNDKTWRV